MDRHEANRLLAKVIAYLACGKRDKAREYAAQLIAALQEAVR